MRARCRWRWGAVVAIAVLAAGCGRRDTTSTSDGVTITDGGPILPDTRPHPLDGPWRDYPYVPDWSYPDWAFPWPDWSPTYPEWGPWPDWYPTWPDYGPIWPDWGPIMPDFGPPTDGGDVCDPICYFAIQCGVFTSSQLAQCQTWCSGMTLAAQTCVQKAMMTGSCSALNQCSTPPPPPPPPPPQECANICTYLTSPPCSLLPSSQYWACYGACMNLTSQKIQCAKNAMAKGQCMQVAMCIL